MPTEFTQQPSGGSSHATRLVMMYDGSGRRISKTAMRMVGDDDWDTTLVTHYTGIGTEIREYKPRNFTRYTDSAGVEHCVSANPDYGGNASTACPLPDTVKAVIPLPHGLGRYALQDVGQVDENGAPQAFEWYLKNHLGSTMLVYGTGFPDPLGISPEGELRAAYDYRSFGEQLDLLVFTRKVTENFTGKEKDDETQLDYFGARYLDPMLGMWISVDPARQFASPYLYAGNGYNPVNGADEEGNEFEDKFKDVKSARTDYKNIYNTKSIKEDVEYATIFVKVESIENGKREQWYTYVKPTKGSQSEVTTPAVPKPIRDKHNPNKILRTYTPVINGDAHTHGSADPNFDWKNPSSTDRENLVTPKGVLFRPDGKVIEYDKNEANDHEIDK